MTINSREAVDAIKAQLSNDQQVFKYLDLTHTIIEAFYKVYNTLGYGFLGKVYENALVVELCDKGLNAIAHFPMKVVYEGTVVGEYWADILVEDKVIIEIKAVKLLLPEHEIELINHLKATHVEVGLLLNFGPKPEIKRKAFSKHEHNHF